MFRAHASSGEARGRQRIGLALGSVAALEALHLLMAVFLFAVLGRSPADMWTGDPAVLASTLVFGVVAMGGLVWLGIVRRGRCPWRDLGWHGDRIGESLALGLVGFGMLVAIVLGMLAVAGHWSDVDLHGALAGYTAAQRAQFLVIGLCAATIEESIFRGYLQPALIAKVGLVGGILIGAVVFGLYHVFMGPSPFNLIGKVCFGLVLGALRGRDRSLVGPMFAHFLFWQVMGSL
jgi:membrane protease YdiL (CAAX protease family)